MVRTARRHGAGRPWWPVVLPIALILASEYKFRSRDAKQSIGGALDAAILLEIGVYGLVALYLYRRFGLRAPRRAAPYPIVFGWGFAGYCLLSVAWSPFAQYALVRGVQMLIVTAVCFVIATRADRDDLHRLVHAYIVLITVSIGIGVVMPFPRTPLTQDRFNWLYVHAVPTGIFLGISVLLIAGIALPGGLPRRWPLPVYLVLLAVHVGALIATGTRGAALGCLAGLAVLLLLARGARGRVEFIMISFPVAVAAGLGLTDVLIGFATRGESVEQLQSLNARTDLWTLAFAAVAKQPIFGNGLSATRGLFLDDIGLGGGHNAYVNVLVEGGAVGLALFGGLILVTATSLLAVVRLRAYRAEAALLLGLIVFFLVDGFTAEMVAAPATAASIWLYLTVAWTHILTYRTPPPPSSGTARPAAPGADRHRF